MSVFSKTSLPPVVRLGGSGDFTCRVRLDTSAALPPRGLVRSRRVVGVQAVGLKVVKAPTYLTPSSREKKKAKRRMA